MINIENNSTQNEHIVEQYINQNYDQMLSHREVHSYSTFKKKPYYMDGQKGLRRINEHKATGAGNN